jgi:sugar phosphate isomerase/epimerase
MKTIKGPAVYLAQFLGDKAPFDTLENMATWAASLGYEGIQVPVDARLIDLEQAAASQTYCDELLGVVADAGVEITELATHLQGQLVAVHPAYDLLFDGFAAPHVRGNPQARTEWAIEQLKLAAQASRRLGLDTHVSFSGALAWPYVYPWLRVSSTPPSMNWRVAGRRFSMHSTRWVWMWRTNCTRVKICMTA